MLIIAKQKAVFTVLAGLCLWGYFGGKLADKSSGTGGEGRLNVVFLRCESLANPLGIHEFTPRFTWGLMSGQRAVTQKAYQILVAGSRKMLEPGIADLWDSGRVESNRSINTAYQGRPLESRMRCFWKVRVWDQTDRVSNWSETAFWEMGLLNAQDWKAEWIGLKEGSPVQNKEVERWIQHAAGPEPRLETKEQILQRLSDLTPALLFRKNISLKDHIRKARAYMSGLGFSELYFNGKKVCDSVLDPAHTDYEKRALYVAHDVTESLKRGENTVGVWLGDGWYGQSVAGFGTDMSYGSPGVILQLEVEYADGESQTFVSDSTWRATPGPILKNNIYAGEVYDARQEIPDWSTAGFDDAEWEQAKVLAPRSPHLEPQLMSPIKAVKTIRPVRLTQPEPGIWIFDMGQNFSGWARLKIRAERGTAVYLRFGEWQDSQGRVNFDSTGHFATGVIQTDLYICRGGEEEIWEPRFTYHGFRYVEMTGYPGIPDLDTIEGVVVRSAVEKAGFFRCSDALINRIHDTVLWTLESNLHGLPTDCPHRERAGWLGDAHVTVEATLYNYQMSQFWQKFIRDIETTSDLKGGLPAAVAPGKRRVGKPPDWGVATVLLPWTCYLFYDDIRFLENHYTYMQRFLEYFYSLSEDWIVEAGLGDWCDPVAHAGAERIGGGGRPQNTRPALTSTAYFFFSANIMDQVATLLGKAEESQLYRAWAQQIKIRFNEVFYDENSADYGSQTADAIALYMGLVPEGDEPKVAHSLAKDVTEKWQGHYSTGSHGITRLFWALQKYGFEDVAFNIFHAQGFPGFPYLFAMGGTTLWERMGSFNPDEIAPDRSLSHPFHGGFDAWFFQGVAGIELDPRFPGFKHFFLKPGLLGQLYFAEAEYESPYGSIRSSWRIEDETFVWNLRVPANTKATVYVPAENCESVTESGQPAEDAPGIKFLRMENGFAVYLLGSGEYSFFAPTYANH